MNKSYLASFLTSLTLSMGIMFDCSAMDDAAYELVHTSEKASSLAAALQALDETYKTREQLFLSGSFNSEAKTTIQRHKKEYLSLVQENRNGVKLADENWQSSCIIMQGKNLKTPLFVLPSYINPQNITCVNLSHNQLEDAPLSLLAKTMPKLKSLHLSHNAISYVATHGKHSFPELTLLMLDHNNIKKIDFVTLLKKCPNLSTLDLSHNPLTEIASDNDSIGMTCVREDLAIDVRSTNLSPEDIALLKRYCLAGVHNSFKGLSCGVCCGGSYIGSGLGWVFVSICAHQCSLATCFGGIGLGIPFASAIAYGVYKKEVREHKEFYAIRHNYEETETTEEIV